VLTKCLPAVRPNPQSIRYRDFIFSGYGKKNSYGKKKISHSLLKKNYWFFLVIISQLCRKNITKISHFYHMLKLASCIFYIPDK